MSKSWNVKVNRAVAPAVRRAAARGVAIAGEHVLAESNKKVPIEEATLMLSGTVTTDPETLQAAVTYDTPYAVYQHEELGLKHNAGREAKFLENAVNAETSAVQEIIAATIRGEF